MKPLFRLALWVLAAVMLCTGAAGAAAEAAGETESQNTVLAGLMDAFDREPAEGLTLSEPGDADAYCLKIYQAVDPDLVEGVFYGGPEETAVLLTGLSRMMYESDAYTDVSLQNAAVYYACVWEILHGDYPDQNKSRPAVKATMKDVFSGGSDDIVSTATDACIDYIGRYEPELLKSGYTMNTNSVETFKRSAESEAYYEKGYQLFEEGRYAEAIEAYSRCLDENPYDMTASFEIIEAYISLRDYESAKSRLNSIAPYLDRNDLTAQWLRRMGFIAIEEQDFETGYALYVYSLEFQESPLARQEIDYILYVAPDTREFSAEEAVAWLEEKGILPFSKVTSQQ